MNHKGTVTLETERLILRRLTLNDAQAAFDNWASDPEVTKFMRWNTHEDIGVTKKWLTDNENKYPDPAFYDWGIQIRKTGHLVGSIGAVNEDNEPGSTEIGYCIGKEHWNHGYTTEALKHVILYLYGDVGIKSFYAKHAVDNPASGAVMMHAGFRYVKNGTYKSFDGLREYECKVYYLDLI